MKKIIVSTLITLICISSVTTFAQYDNNFAVGLKVGEPLALNLRKYFREGERAFDINVGVTGFPISGSRKYKKETIYDKAGFTIQGLFLYNKALGASERVHVYYGYGAHMNRRDLITSLIGTRDTNTKLFSFGPAVNAGIEFKLPDNDMGLFLDTGSYFELAPNPLFTVIQINVGLRLNIIR